MNFILILSIIPDDLLTKVCGDLHLVVDALAARDMEGVQTAWKRIVENIANTLEARGVTPEKVVEMIESLGLDLPFDITEMLRSSKH